VIRRSSAPESIRMFFGDGVFLVAAWVGMWYPPRSSRAAM
jgi:hypothetical protein